MKSTLILFLAFTIGNLNAQQSDSLTAQEIIEKSIEFCGGKENIEKIETTELSYVYLGKEGKRVAVSDKIATGEKYSQSILSFDYQSQSTFFNGKELARVDGESITKVSDISSIEEIRLKTYSQLQYGYLKEAYEFTRLKDEKFNHFDCYVVQAEAKSGYSTLNFFDKTNFRLLMVVYPNGGKSCMIKYKFIDDVLFNSTILNITPENEQQQLILLSAQNNLELSDLWFQCPYDSVFQLPQEIKTGKFSPVNRNSMLERTDNIQTESLGNGNSKITLYLTWRNEDTFYMVDEQSIKEKLEKPAMEVLVRIVSWDENGYICHYMSGDIFGTHAYKRVE